MGQFKNNNSTISSNLALIIFFSNSFSFKTISNCIIFENFNFLASAFL